MVWPVGPVMVILAPGNGAPEASRTVPAMLPVETVLWLKPEPDISANVTVSASTRANRPQYCRETLALTFDHPFETLTRYASLAIAQRKINNLQLYCLLRNTSKRVFNRPKVKRFWIPSTSDGSQQNSNWENGQGANLILPSMAYSFCSIGNHPRMWIQVEFDKCFVFFCVSPHRHLNRRGSGGRLSSSPTSPCNNRPGAARGKRKNWRLLRFSPRSGGILRTRCARQGSKPASIACAARR